MIRAHHIIPAVLSDVIRKAPFCPEKVAFAWRAAVGPAVERMTTVRLDQHGVLHVTAEPHWAREVKRSSKLILTRLAVLLGDDVVKKLRTSQEHARR